MTMTMSVRDYAAEIAEQERLQQADPKAAYREQARVRRLAQELEALARRARDLVRV
jgi:hypothetical protein